MEKKFMLIITATGDVKLGKYRKDKAIRKQVGGDRCLIRCLRPGKTHEQAIWVNDTGLICEPRLPHNDIASRFLVELGIYGEKPDIAGTMVIADIGNEVDLRRLNQRVIDMDK